MKSLGSLIVVTGSMFAGKSEELIRQLRRAMYAKKKVQAFKHVLDNRYELAEIRTHEGGRLEAIPVSTSMELAKRIKKDTDVIGIEEAQFFDPGLVDLCVKLADKGKTVIAAGLDQDFRRQPFSHMPLLMTAADEVIKLRAICVKCGNVASHTQRLVDGEPARWNDPIIVIGASESYEARCRACHEITAPQSRSKLTAKRSKNGRIKHHNQQPELMIER